MREAILPPVDLAKRSLLVRAVDNWRSEWASKKQKLALELSRGACGGSYGEAVLILCAALSALAAEVWPGVNIDRRRFVQFLKQFAAPELSATLISVPILAASLRSKQKRGPLERLKQAYLDYDPSQVLTGQEVDRSEEEILSVCPSLGLKEVRDCSYANLLYRELRSGYVHEYRPTGKTVSWPMTQDKKAHVSYFNWIHDPDRHIHFHVGWLSALTTTSARAVDDISHRLPLRKPRRWWIDG